MLLLVLVLVLVLVLMRVLVLVRGCPAGILACGGMLLADTRRPSRPPSPPHTPPVPKQAANGMDAASAVLGSAPTTEHGVARDAVSDSSSGSGTNRAGTTAIPAPEDTSFRPVVGTKKARHGAHHV